MPPTVVAVGDVGGRLAGGIAKNMAARCQTDCCDTEWKLMLFACGGRHDGTVSGSFR